MKQFKLNNNIYTIDNCTVEDIPSHMQRVYSYWSKDKYLNIGQQKLILYKAIKENNAFKVYKNNKESVCAYYINSYSKYKQGVLLWLNSKISLCILGHYLRKHLKVSNFIFRPHSMKFIPFKFLIEESSVKNYYKNSRILEINLYSNKCNNFYNKYMYKDNIFLLKEL